MRSYVLPVLLLIGGIAQADTWKKIKLRSSDGTNIHIDYKVRYDQDRKSYKPTNQHIVGPLHVNVLGKNIKPGDKVRIVLDQHEGADRGVLPKTYQLDLKASHSDQYGTHFSGKIDDADVSQFNRPYGKGSTNPITARTDGYGGVRNFRQEVSVVVNGDWKKDPINGTSNFKVNLYDHAASTP